jgi:hypothetical protein
LGFTSREVARDQQKLLEVLNFAQLRLVGAPACFFVSLPSDFRSHLVTSGDLIGVSNSHASLSGLHKGFGNVADHFAFFVCV